MRKKWLLTVNSFETTNSVFKKTDENNSFSITTPGHWFSRGGEEPFYILQKLLELKSQNDIELQVEEIRKKGNQIEIEDKEYKLSELDTHKIEIIEELQM